VRERALMLDISLRWQDGAIQLGIYIVAIVAILWVMSKIEVKGGGEAPIERERER
jgi:hypothetical protein